MKEWILEHKISLISGFVIAIAVFFYYADNQESSGLQNNEIKHEVSAVETTGENAEEEKKSSVKVSNTMMVDIKGEVKLPGVYQSNEGERVIDLINKAGGLTEKADKNQINLAEHIVDEMVIVIPAIGATTPSQSGTSSASLVMGGKSADNQMVNLNKADETQLQTLPGIGPSKAAAIIEYRETTGPFKTVEDLKEISGIGDKTFEKLKELISVN